MNRERILLVAAALIAALAVLLVWADIGGSAVRALFGLPLALLLPGYAVSASVLRRELRGVERLVWSLGLSLGLTVMGGFLINVLPGGLNARSWAGLLGAVTLAGCAYGLVRTRGAVATEPWRPQIALWQGAVWSAALVLLVVAVSMARAGAAAPTTPGFSQLWMLPDGAQGVQLGVVNAEHGSVSYRVRLEADRTLLKEWDAVTLADGERWEQKYTLPATAAAALVEASLYRTDAPTVVYRRVTISPAAQEGQ